MDEYYNVLEVMAPSKEFINEMVTKNPDINSFLFLSLGVSQLWPSVEDTRRMGVFSRVFRIEPGSILDFGQDVEWEFTHNNFSIYDVMGISGLIFDRSGKVVSAGFEGFKVGSDIKSDRYLSNHGFLALEKSKHWMIFNEDLKQVLAKCKDNSLNCPVDMAYRKLIEGLGIE